MSEETDTFCPCSHERSAHYYSTSEESNWQTLVTCMVADCSCKDRNLNTGELDKVMINKETYSSGKPQRYQKKPAIIEAMQWTGYNWQICFDWTGGNFYDTEEQSQRLYVAANSRWLPITVGTWIIKDRLGFYPCDPEIFEESYRHVE